MTRGAANKRGGHPPRSRPSVDRRPPPLLDTRADRVSRIGLHRVRIVFAVGDDIRVRAGLAGDGVGGRSYREGNGKAQDRHCQLKKGHNLIGRGGGNM